MTLLLSLLLLGPTVVFAGEVEEAEHRRLNEEMQKLAQRNAWTGVERNFQDLLALQKKGEVISYDEWYLGAQAARALGDMTSCRNRLASAVKVEGTEDAISWMEQIDASYHPVDLKTVDREAEASLVIKGMPFAPDQRAAVEFAQQKVETERQFVGLLPAGEYTFTSGDVSQTFTVVVGGDPVLVKLTPSQAGGTAAAIAYVGPRLELGGAYTLGGAPVLPTAAQISQGGLPPGFGGAGARLGVGLEVGLKRGFGVMAQVGYHNLVSPSPRDDLDNVPNVNDSLHLGYGTVGLTYRLADLWLGVGGTGGFGVARVAGISDLDGVNTACPYGSEDPKCSWVSGVQEEHREYYPWAGSISASGFQASAGYAFMEVGESLQGGVALTGGMLFDPHRNYPWGQVSFVVGPAKKTRNQ